MEEKIEKQKSIIALVIIIAIFLLTIYLIETDQELKNLLFPTETKLEKLGSEKYYHTYESTKSLTNKEDVKKEIKKIQKDIKDINEIETLPSSMKLNMLNALKNELNNLNKRLSEIDN